MKRHYLILLLILSFVATHSAQIASPIDSLAVSASSMDSLSQGFSSDKLLTGQDSLVISADSTVVDTSKNEDDQFQKRITLTISKDAPEAEITFGARDTQWLELETSNMHLFGDAFVKYENYEIKAGYIIFSFEDNTAYAESISSPDGETVGKPSFTDGTQNFTYNRLKYNFKTKKGIVYDAVTTEGEFYVHGAKTKFVSSESDSLQMDDIICNENALITSCNHDHPHFGFRAHRLKVIPEKLAVVGRTNLEIAGVPTPLWLPFGFFPIAGGTSDGLIFPRDYKYDNRWGFGLLEVGYYFPINDYLDLKLTGDIYTRGSHGLRALSNYKKRYKYTGSINLGYSNTLEENTETGIVESSKSFSIILKHDQDSKAHPYRKIGGKIDFQTGDYRTRNFTDAGAQFQNIYGSQLSYSYNFPGKPLSLSAGMSHSQNVTTGDMNITLPDATLTLSTTKPFQKKNRGSNPESWYEKIAVSYTNKTKSFVKTTDSLLFTKEVLDDLQYGMSHDASANVSLTAFKYFTFTPRINYDEIWFFRTLDRDIDDNIYELDSVEIDIRPDDSIVYRVDTLYTAQDQFVNNFRTYRRMEISFGLGTNLFGTSNFSKGWLRGIRHHMKPTLTFKYVPETQAKYQELYYTHVNESIRDSIYYNPFSGGVFGTPRLSEEQLALDYSLTNILEAKRWSKKDSTAKKFRLFDNISVNGSYNFAADSLKWSMVRIGANTKLFKGLTDFRFNMALDPYVRNANGAETATTIWSEKGKPLQFNNANFSFTTRLTFKQIFEVIKGKEPSDEDVVMNNNATRGREFERNSGLGIDLKDEPPTDEEIIRGDDIVNDEQVSQEEKSFEPKQARFLDLIDNFKVNHTIGWMGIHQRVTERDSFFMSNNSLSLEGRFNVTDNWDISIDRITYDFKNKTLVYPSFTFSRNLHCWKMNFTWQPNGGTYSFFIGVQSSQLDFLKYRHGQNNLPGGR